MSLPIVFDRVQGNHEDPYLHRTLGQSLTPNPFASWTKLRRRDPTNHVLSNSAHVPRGTYAQRRRVGVPFADILGIQGVPRTVPR